MCHKCRNDPCMCYSSGCETSRGADISHHWRAMPIFFALAVNSEAPTSTTISLAYENSVLKPGAAFGVILHNYTGDMSHIRAPIDSAWKVIPMLKSRDIAATVKFYTEELGFDLGGTHSHDDQDANRDAADQSATTSMSKPNAANTEIDSQEQTPHSSVLAEATFCSVYAGPKAATNFYFFKAKDNNDFRPSDVMIALGTEELDIMYHKLTSRGRNIVRIVEPIEDKSWGYRQFTILDIDGNRLSFFKFLEGGNPGED